MTTRPAQIPIDSALDDIDAESGPCRVLGPFGPDMILVSDLTAEIRRLRRQVDRLVTRSDALLDEIDGIDRSAI